MEALSIVIGLIGVVIAALIGLFAFNQAKEHGINVMTGVSALIGLIVIFVAFSISSSFGQIENGEIGLQKSMGGFTGKSFGPGMYTTMPVFTSVQVVDLHVQHQTAEQSITTKDNQSIPIKASINFNLDGVPEHLTKTMAILGTDYYDVAIASQFNASLRAVLPKYTYPQLNSNLDAVTNEVVADTERRVRQISGTDAIQITQVSLTGIEPSDAYKQAGEQKAIAQQQAATAQINEQRVQFETNQQVIKAKGQAEAQKAQSRSITADWLKAQQIEIARAAVDKWDGHLAPLTSSPFGPGGGLGNSVVDMRGLMQGLAASSQDNK